MVEKVVIHKAELPLAMQEKAIKKMSELLQQKCIEKVIPLFLVALLPLLVLLVLLGLLLMCSTSRRYLYD